MYFQKPGRKSEKPGRNPENLEKISKKPMATLCYIKKVFRIRVFYKLLLYFLYKTYSFQ